MRLPDWRTVSVVLILGIFIFGAVQGCRELVDVLTEDKFEPVEIQELRVAPTEVDAGETVTIYNYICSDWDSPLSIRFTVQAHQVTGDPILKENTVNLAGTQGEELGGFPRGFINPGCTSGAGIDREIPEELASVDGQSTAWVIVIQMIVIGPSDQIQNVVKVSDPFTVN